jgi:hypothetical protein
MPEPHHQEGMEDSYHRAEKELDLCCESEPVFRY